MSLLSFSFFAFLAAVCLISYCLPLRAQNAVLLAASGLYLYWAAPSALAVLAVEIAVVYALGRAMESANARARRGLLAVGVVLCLGGLLALKYSGMLYATLAAVLPMPEQTALSEIVSAVGISYYTLMSIAYLADVNAGRVKAEKDPLLLALFLAFFPQIQSGPIGRAGALLPQFKKRRVFSADRFGRGAARMLLGAFKKTVIADSLALAVDPVFNDPASFSGPLLVLAALLFSYQLYCDFSGYTDIARGAAELVGIDLAENFRRPFAARSFGRLWNRWHMSLSGWFRDYIYFPLGGSRNGTARMVLATLVVFGTSGLWHIAGWVFLAWGLLNGLFLVAEKLTKTQRAALAEKLPGYRGSRFEAVWQVTATYLIFSFCFILFRMGENREASSFMNCAYYYVHMLTGWGILARPAALVTQLKAMSIGYKLAAYLTLSIALNEGMDFFAAHEEGDTAHWLASRRAPLRTALVYAMVLLILFFGQVGASSFIYNQF